MDSVYVIGHKNPDTDSVVSAMAYAALQNALGSGRYIAARYGHLNTETAFLLNRFGFEPPVHLRTVRTQVADIDYDTPPTVGAGVPVSYAWQIIHKDNNRVSGIPITQEDGRLFGLITAGGMAENDMRSVYEPVVSAIPVFNLLSALEGHIINAEQDIFDEISGEVVIALPGNEASVKSGAIVLCGDQKEVADKAVECGAACLIFCGTSLGEQYRGLSSSTCLIVCPFDAYRAARMIFQSVPVGRIACTEGLQFFHLSDYLDDVRDRVIQSRFRSYPVLDEQDRVIGTLSRYHLIRPRRKKVVLVDHNEMGQAVAGLEQADIIGIIDHHRLADVQTGNPVFMRNEPIGSTTSIIAKMYQEHGLMPSKQLAGLMAAAIISDTVMFKSPTCTPHDRTLAERLARHAGIDCEELGRSMFSRGVSADMPAEDLLRYDMKEFHLASHSLAISQITTVDSDPFLRMKDAFVESLEKIRREKQYDIAMMMITNVLKEGTELLFSGDEEIIRNAFSEDVRDHHVFLPQVLSRKKQIVPALSQIWG
ncbi:MAG: putative manganese-dependent inorganic diphosphatase [Clostridia bacterium]|nr:putative manganese-dependent inorganic diphosphatase [Clostridia bacterium]